MSVEKNIKLQVNHPIEYKQNEIEAATPTNICDINIQVANGWEITGHYRNQTLQTITLQKSMVAEENKHG